MKRILALLFITIFVSNTAAEQGATSFPWLMTSYRYSHLTSVQENIYRHAYFETMGFLLYGSSDKNDHAQMKILNGWIDCVASTKNENFWKNVWVLGDDVDKSAAYVLHRTLAPVQCKEYFEKAGTEPRVLQLYEYSDWDKWSIEDKSIYLSGYIDTVASVEMHKMEFGAPNYLRELGMVVDARGETSILSDIMETNSRGNYPLPWFIARGLSVSLEKVRSE